MTETSEQQAPPLPDSTFHLWRCVIAVAQADGQVSDAELSHLKRIFAELEKAYKVTPQQMTVFGEDLIPPGTGIATLLPRVTEAADRKVLFYFGGLMAQSDGEMAPKEDAILRKIGCAGKLPEEQVSAYLAEAHEYVLEKAFCTSLEESHISHKSAFREVVESLLERLALLKP